MKNVGFIGVATLILIIQCAACAAADPQLKDRRIDAKQAGKPTAAVVVSASAAGAVLDSDLMKGAGTDDTAVLQRVLDRAGGGRPVHLLVDGVALVGGLEIYGNTTLECVRGGGLYLKDGSSRAIVRNAHRSRTQIVDERITVRGCFLNGNRDNQPGARPERTIGNNQEADGTYISGLQFFGVNDLVIEDVTLWGIRSFSAWIANANRIDVRNVIVDHGGPEDIDLHYANVDGLHFNGPIRYLTIDGLKFRTGDDGIALNADDVPGTDDMTVRNDMGPYVGQGPITDVTVSNVQLMEAVQGFRLLSSKQRIDRVMISNVTGTIKGGWLATLSNFMHPSPGNFGSVTFSNVNVDRVLPDSTLSTEWVRMVREDKTLLDEFNDGVAPLININAHIDSLILKSFSSSVVDSRPIIRLGPNAKVRSMTAELSLHDPPLIGVPLEIDAIGYIGRLNLSVDWHGELKNPGKNPIINNGGRIDQLYWTPPMVSERAILPNRGM